MEPEVDAAARPNPPAGPNWAVLAFAVAVGALIVAGAAWFQSRAALTAIRAGLQGSGGDAARANSTAIIDLTGAPTLGSADATVALVEFSDYECPYCMRHFKQTMPQIVANYINNGKIRYAFRDWPVDQLHPQAIRAHEAAHCAGEQKRYWDMHGRLFGPSGSHTPAQLMGLARDIGLDMTTFESCFTSGRATPPIRAMGEMAMNFGASGTPAFFLGLHDKATQKVTIVSALAGAQPFEVFARAIDEVLAKAR
jgi:protein-disulfide isomerase